MRAGWRCLALVLLGEGAPTGQLFAALQAQVPETALYAAAAGRGC